MFLDDQVSATFALLLSSRERIRLSRLYCDGLRTIYCQSMETIRRSRETVQRNELSMTPELARLVQRQSYQNASDALTQAFRALTAFDETESVSLSLSLSLSEKIEIRRSPGKTTI